MAAGREPWVDRLLDDLEPLPIVDEAAIDRYGHRLLEPSVLSDGEKRALEVISHGLTPADAGVLLHRSPHTIRQQLKQARRKMRAKNTTHAACEAIRMGLIR